MNREIKFRIVDENGEMKYGELENMAFRNCCYWLGKYYRKENTEIMQYTGLKDKNGKEIYEGDIVRSRLILDNSAVEFRNGSFWIYLAPLGEFLDLYVDNTSKGYNIEVIGNIYENPELLSSSNG